MVLCIFFIALSNFYLASIVKDGYNEIYDENLSSIKKALLLIPPVGILIFCGIISYLLVIYFIDRIKNYFS
jgi:lantibiotic modifying enzyme